MMVTVFFCETHNKQNITGIDRYIQFLIKEIDTSNVTLKKINTTTSIFNKLIPKKIAKFFSFYISIPFKLYYFQPDVLFCPRQRIPFFIPQKTAVVVTIHDLCYKKEPATMRFIGRMVDRLSIPYAIKKADLVVTVSQNTAREIIEHFPDFKKKVRVTLLSGQLNGIGHNNIKQQNKEHFILCVGTIEPRKNLNYLIQAYSSLSQKIKEKYKLVIVGRNGWGNVRLEEQVKKLNLQNNVVLKAYVTDEELTELYRHAFCLTMPSLYEGFGLPIIEAQGFGVPVVTSNTSSMPEVAGKGAILVDPYSVESIREGLEKLLTNDVLRQELSIKAVENAAKYSWERTSQLTLEAFKEAIAIKCETQHES